MSRTKFDTLSYGMGKKRSESLKKIRIGILKLVIGFLLISVAGTLLFRFATPPFPSVMAIQSVSKSQYNPDGKLLQSWKPLPQISCNLIRAVTAAEDQTFEAHFGFDLRAIKTAFRHNLSGKHLRGGSTITQQTAKNLFLWHGRSFIRKGFEAYFSLLMEALWSKKRIMEVYLNIVELGDGIYGAEAAANTYFKKNASSLTKRESALLAAMLPSPKTRDPLRPSRSLSSKANWILDQMDRMRQTQLCDQAFRHDKRP